MPYEDKERFQRCTFILQRLDASEDAISAVRDELWKYMLDLVAAKRQRPDCALLGSLIQTGAADTALTDEQLAGIGQLLLAAGHETTANMLALGTFALLGHPDQLCALREEADLVDGAVEELLRYLTVVQRSVRAGLMRCAWLARLGQLCARHPRRRPDVRWLSVAGWCPGRRAGRGGAGRGS